MQNQPPQSVQVSRIPGTATIPVEAHPAPPRASLSKARFILAFIVAVASDAASLLTDLIPPLQWIIDGTTAILLFLLLGRRWQILPALVAEAVPGLAMLPFWVLVVLTVLAAERKAHAPPTTRPGTP